MTAYKEKDYINALKVLGGSQQKPNTATEVFEYLCKEKDELIEKQSQKYKNGCRTVTRALRSCIGKSDTAINELVEDDGFGIKDLDFYSIGFKKIGKQIVGYWYIGKIADDLALARYLSDVIIYSKVINPEFKEEYIKRLQDIFGHGSVKGLVKGESFEEKIISLKPFAPNALNGDAIDVLDNVLQIQKAIDMKKKIEFKLCVYKVSYETGETKICLDVPNDTRAVSPYQIIMSNGRYYLIAGDDKKKIKYYRIDLMIALEITHKSCVATSKEDWKEPNKYLVSNPYLYGGETEDIVIGFQEQQVTQLVDWFGTEENGLYEIDQIYEIYKPIVDKKGKKKNEKIDMLRIKFKGVNISAFSFWVMQYLDCVEILEGENLIKLIKERIDWAHDQFLFEEEI